MKKPEQRVDVLMHVPFEGPGAIGDIAESRGAHLQTHHLYAGDPLPHVDAIENLVVMGGPMGALDDTQHPWLADVRDLLTTLIAKGTPVLGVCLGAQLLAAACGARVYCGPHLEIGAGSVTLTDAAATDPLFKVVTGTQLDVFHWHGDTFDLPDGATLLASSDQYPNQAFRIANAWGLQFHVELRAADASSISAHLGDGRSVLPVDLSAIEPNGSSIINAFLDLASTRVSR